MKPDTADWRRLDTEGDDWRGARVRRIAAILITAVATVMMRVATHGRAALHRLLRRDNAKRVESIRRKSDDQCRRDAFSEVTHE